MIEFRTTPEQALNVARYALQMAATGLPQQFVAKVMELAQRDQGVYELLELWTETSSEDEKEALVADLQEAIDEEEDLPRTLQVKPKIDFDALETVAKRVLEHKRKLRELIDRHGGVSAAARLMGVPQPSLSRMLNSASMPRRTTLYKLAKALDVDETEVVTEWAR